VGNVFVTGLTIDAGVTVMVDGNWEIEVAGRLEVNGTCDSPVLFTPVTTNGWKGILFRDAVPGSYFNAAIIEGANMSAVRITNTPPAFTNCVLRNNSAPKDGGAIAAVVPSGLALILSGCVLSNNVANPTTSGSAYGGAIYSDGSLVLVQSLVVSNRTRSAHGYGGGVFVHSGNCTMQNCSIVFNRVNATTYADAHGVYFDGATLSLRNCVVSSNGIPGAGAYYSGAGLLFWAGTANLLNSLFIDNSHQGIYFRSGRGSIVNCTIAHNGNTDHWGVYAHSGTFGITNSIVFYHYQGNVAGNVVCDYSDIQGGGCPGTNNISYSPALCPANLSLVAGSPCIDAGSPDPLYNDACMSSELCSPGSRGTGRNDMGAWGGPGACFGIGTRPWCFCEPPIIASQPSPVSSCLGQTATFSVVASGSSSLAYQWWFNETPILGATESALVLTNLTESNAGMYWVTVTDDCGPTASLRVPLTIFEACVDICMYAGLRISGLSGKTYELRYTTDLNNTNFSTWAFLATNSTPWFYVDTNSCGSPKRYYGVKLLP
jgi:predicted outer membrane repeat protein